MKVPTPFRIEFQKGHVATAVRADPDADPRNIVNALNLASPPGLLMLAGGAGKMSGEQLSKITPFIDAASEAVISLGITVIDGGTNVGVMALMGSSLERSGGSVTHIGVLPAYAEAGSGQRGEEILDPHHTHFVLVESDRWGRETRLMYRLAELLSGRIPSLALLVDGGKIALDEVVWNVYQKREIVVVSGSGRIADDIATAVKESSDDLSDQMRKIIQGGKFTFVDVSDPPMKLKELILARLKAV